MAEVTATQPQTAAPTPAPVKKKGPGKKKMVKRLIALGVAAAVLGVVVMHAPFTFPDFLGFVAIAIAVVLLNRGGASTSSD